MSSRQRVGLGTQIGAFVTAVIGSTVASALFETLIPWDGVSGFSIAVFLVSFAITLIPTAFFAAIIGIPLIWVLAKLRVERWWMYALAGFGAGVLISAALDLWVMRFAGGLSTDWFPRWVLTGIAGAVAGVIWWLIARRRANSVPQE